MIMPRPKGSKNKPKTGKLSSAADYAAAIEAKAAEKAQLEQNISETLDQINAPESPAQSQPRRALKATDNAIAKLETKKVNAEAKAALDAQKTELDSTVQKLLDRRHDHWTRSSAN